MGNLNITSYSYDARGQITEVYSGGTLTYTVSGYDRNGYSILTETTEGGTLLASYVTRADGLLEQATDGAGNVTKYQYNQQKQVTGLTITAADGTTLYSEQNFYNKNGSLVAQFISGEGYDNETLSYTYDSLDRLLSETKNGQTTSYTYDSMGNRLTRTENGVTTSYVYDLCNKLLAETTSGVETAYSYDALGNLTAKTDSTGVTTYSYDALNQLAEVVNPDGTWQHNTYDASSIRSMIAENGVTTEFMTFNGLVLSGYNKNGEQTEHYYYGNSLLAAEYVTGNTSADAETDLYYYLKNSHGDVIGFTDSTGTLTETYRYGAFGTLTSIQSLNENGVLAEAETALSRFLYAGEQLDNTTGLYYLRARQYDTVLGRFPQEDTYLGDGRNLYVYVSNNPLKYMDPSGHEKEVGYTLYGNSYFGFMPQEIKEFQKQQEKAGQQAWLNALNAGFTMPDSYAGYVGQQWGNYIAPTVKNDPAGSAYAFKEGFLDAVIPFRSSEDYYYTDLYMTGQMFGMIFTGGVSEAVSGMNTLTNIKSPMVSMQPQYSLAGVGSYSVSIAGTLDGALVAEGLAGAYFGWSVGTTIGSTVNSYSIRPEAAVTGSKKHGVNWKEGLARAKATGNPQGQWAESDLDFATEMANTLKAGESAYFDLPKGSRSIVYMPDGTMKPATRIWIRNNGTGTWHGYPMP